MVSIILSLTSCVRTGLGDVRFVRQIPEMDESDGVSVDVYDGEPIPDACRPFVNVSATTRVFYSPGYPADTYTNNTECVLVLRAPKGHLIKLDFRDWFEIEYTPGCKNDYLEVRDGPHGYNSIIHEPFCGRGTFPPVITSTDRYLWIHFRSDENIEYRGFKAVFEFTKRPDNLKSPEIIPCVMNSTLMEEGELGKVNITKDIMDFYIQHDMPIDCLFMIVVRPNWRIYLQFAEFNLEKPNDCHSNFVQVFSGKTDMSSIEKEFCGSIADTVLSKSNKMYVRFFSEAKGPKTLFLANFTAYRDLGSDGGKTKECNKTNEFYCEDATCIHKSLVCNSRYNCRFRWDEEDEGCQGAQTMAWSGDHIIIIMIIFSLILTGMCITFLYNCVTKLIRDHQTIQEYRSRSLEQQLNELDKQQELAVVEGKASSKLSRRSRSHDSSHSMDSNRFDSINAINSTSCYAGEGDVLSILVRNERSTSPSSGDAFNTNIYTVDADNPPQMCDSACQTRESLFTTQGYNSSDNSTPNHSAHTNSPPAPFSTFGYKKEMKFKAEAKIEMTPTKIKQQQHSHKKDDKHRLYSVSTTKSAPDVIVTH